MRLKFKALITANGTLHAVYNDFIPRLNLGPLKVQRVSNVEFDAKNQVWEARDADRQLIAWHPEREECLRREKKVIEERLLAGDLK